MDDDIVIEPAQAGSDTLGERPPELLLLFHGVGSSPQDLRPLGQWLAQRHPQDTIVCVRSPQRSDLGSGWQWFSVAGITEAERPLRVAGAMPEFQEKIRAWQRETAIPAARTTLIGFSQGAIMALESTQQAGPLLSARVISIAGRFAQNPRQAPEATAVHLLHGQEDPVIPVACSYAAEQHLRAIGARVSLQTFSGLGHGIDQRVAWEIERMLSEPRIVIATAP